MYYLYQVLLQTSLVDFLTFDEIEVQLFSFFLYFFDCSLYMLYLYMRKYNNCCFFFFPKIIEDMSKDIGIGGVRVLIVIVRIGRFSFFIHS